MDLYIFRETLDTIVQFFAVSIDSAIKLCYKSVGNEGEYSHYRRQFSWEMPGSTATMGGVNSEADAGEYSRYGRRQFRGRCREYSHHGRRQSIYIK